MGADKEVQTVNERDVKNCDNHLPLEEIMTKLKGIGLSECPEEEYKDFVNGPFVHSLVHTLPTTNNPVNVLRILAEIAKSDAGRRMCVKEEKIFEELKVCLELEGGHSDGCEGGGDNEGGAEVSFEACRLLGNLCYDSEVGRQLAMDHLCHISVLHLLNALCRLIQHHNTLHHPPTTTIPHYPPSTTTTPHKHLKTAASALINLICDHTSLQDAVLDGGLMDVVGKMLSISSSSSSSSSSSTSSSSSSSPPSSSSSTDDIVDCCFSLIEFYDLSKPQLKMLITKATTHHHLFDVITSSQDQNVIDSVFQTLATFSEDDEVKSSLCRSGFVERLVGLMEGWNKDGGVVEEDDGVKNEGGVVDENGVKDEDLVKDDGVKNEDGVKEDDRVKENEGVKSEDGVKEDDREKYDGGVKEDDGGVKLGDHINDCIVLLLTGDESMSLLFDGGDGGAYRCMRKWLSLKQPLKLITTAVFAMCNFARSDENCRVMMEGGLVGELLLMLQQHPPTSPHHLLHHAIFGTLVNLAISPSNRGGLEGVVDACLTFSSTPSPTVLFKILACLRMLSSNNEGVVTRVVEDVTFMKLLNQSASSQHNRIMSEALRLYSSLIRGCTKATTLCHILAFDGLKNILKLVDCEHLMMKNEALLALIHLLLHKSLDEVQLMPFSDGIINQIQGIILPESSSSLPPTSSAPPPSSSSPSPSSSTPPPSSSTPSPSLSSPSPSSSSSPPPALTTLKQPVEVVCNTLNLLRLLQNIPPLHAAFLNAGLYKEIRSLHHTDPRLTTLINQF